MRLELWFLWLVSLIHWSPLIQDSLSCSLVEVGDFRVETWDWRSTICLFNASVSATAASEYSLELTAWRCVAARGLNGTGTCLCRPRCLLIRSSFEACLSSSILIRNTSLAKGGGCVFFSSNWRSLIKSWFQQPLQNCFRRLRFLSPSAMPLLLIAVLRITCNLCRYSTVICSYNG